MGREDGREGRGGEERKEGEGREWERREGKGEEGERKRNGRDGGMNMI